jgi:hypothetical protein
MVSGDRVLIGTSFPPRPREIWAFVTANADVVVHRCVGLGSDGWRFHGDARREPDEPVGDGQLIGRVEVIEHGGRPRRVGIVDRALRGRIVPIQRKLTVFRHGAQ